MPGALGRRTPTTWTHVEKYPLTAPRLAEITVPRPVVIGIDWFDDFDSPEQDSAGKWWIGRNLNRLGSVRGGHSVCLKPYGIEDTSFWYRLYDQGEEGICVSMAGSRAQSLNNRRSYQPRWLYDRCKEIDGDNEEGTWVDSAMKVEKAKGLLRRKLGDSLNLEPHALDSATPTLSDGISAYRWIRSIDDALTVLGQPNRDYVILLNSWGTFYPHYVRMPAATLEYLWFRDGEIAVSTDR